MKILMYGIWSELTKNPPIQIGTSCRDFSSELMKLYPNTPHPIGTSHGGLRDFSSELTKNTPTPTELELLMEDCVGD